MADSKFYQVKKTIGGKEYIAQFGGISVALRMSTPAPIIAQMFDCFC